MICNEFCSNSERLRSLTWAGYETELRQISNRRRDKFYFALVSNYLTEESESDCIEHKA